MTQTRMLGKWGNMSIQLGPAGHKVKVTDVSEDGCRVFFEWRNGVSGWFDQQDNEFCKGRCPATFRREWAPTGRKNCPVVLGPISCGIGVVRIKLEDITVIAVGGQNRRVPTTTDVKYDVGNTVEAGDVQGVVRVLSNTPISLIDLPSLDDNVTDEFLWKPPEGTDLVFDDFGGLKEVVTRARELIEVPLQHREALSKNRSAAHKGRSVHRKPRDGEDNACPDYRPSIGS